MRHVTSVLVIIAVLAVATVGCLGGSDNVNDYDDDGFRSFVLSTVSGLRGILDDIVYYSSNYDVEGLGNAGDDLYYAANHYLSQANAYSVSSSCQPLKNEVLAALSDSRQAGYYIREGADSLDADLLSLGADYLTKATAHWNNVSGML